MMIHFARKFQLCGMTIGPFTSWDISMLPSVLICDQQTLQEDAKSVGKMSKCQLTWCWYVGKQQQELGSKDRLNGRSMHLLLWFSFTNPKCF